MKFFLKYCAQVPLMWNMDMLLQLKLKSLQDGNLFGLLTFKQVELNYCDLTHCSGYYLDKINHLWFSCSSTVLICFSDPNLFSWKGIIDIWISSLFIHVFQPVSCLVNVVSGRIDDIRYQRIPQSVSCWNNLNLFMQATWWEIELFRKQRYHSIHGSIHNRWYQIGILPFHIIVMQSQSVENRNACFHAFILLLFCWNKMRHAIRR